MLEDRLDVVVVGAGLAGLTAAAVAARNGRSVVALDGRGPGGRASTDVREGFRFNQGAHALYRDGAGRAVLGRLGIVPTGAQPPAGGLMGLRDGELGLFPGDPVSLLRSPLLGARSKAKIGTVLKGLRRIDAGAHAHLSAAGWLDSLGLHADAAQVLEALIHVTSFANDLADISADAVIGQLQMALKNGVDYLDRGWDQLVVALCAAATTAGARLQPGAPVVGIESDDDGWTVHTSGRAWRAGAVVIANGGPDAARALLPVDPAWGEVGPDQTAACLDLGLRRAPRHRAVFGLGEPLYFSVHCPPADLAPAGQVVVHVMRYGARTSAEDRAQLDGLAATAGVDQADVVAARFLHRMVVVNGSPKPGLGLAGRPRVAVAGAPGIFVAGDWVGSTGMLSDASFASAEAASLAAIAHVAKVRTRAG